MKNHSSFKHAKKTLDDAAKIKKISSEILIKKYNSKSDSQKLQNLVNLSKIMNNIVKSTDSAMKGAKLAESRAKARFAAVKKATSDTIKYTAKAKRAAISSKKATEAAAATYRKIQTNPNNTKNLQISYKIQIKANLKNIQILP